jgi:hypothetical protein
MKSRLVTFCYALGALWIAPQLQAQYELKAGNFNGLYVPYTAAGAAATPYGPPAKPSQISNQSVLPATELSNFRGVGAVSGSSAVMDFTPADGSPGAIAGAFADRYPSSAPLNIDERVVLGRSTVGGMFASGVPRYFMGDVILPPLVQADGVTTAPAGYWRGMPVAPGEVVNGSTPVAAYSVNVTASATDSKLVTVATVPTGLVVGATLLGQPITVISGTSVTLAGNADRTITASTAVKVTPALTYHYSPHAEKVFASQPGRVTITWMSLAANAGVYGVLTETFAVSSNTSAPVRTIFWTEGGFDGPKVDITDSRITTVSPVYQSSVPKAVASEVIIPGYEPTVPNLTTLSFDKYNGSGQLHAYNVEGRILIEYLGKVRLGANVYEFIGSEVVDLVRAPTANFAQAYLGQEILPHDGDPALEAFPVLNSQQNAASFHGTSVDSEGNTRYYAERETSSANDPDDGNPTSSTAYNQVVFYWKETGTFGIQWPKFQDRYWLRWSPDLADYAHFTVGTTGSTADTGMAFTDGALPQIVYQDDPRQLEARIDLASQRLSVTFPAGADTRNRSLLKFNSSGVNWYVNLYTQAEDRQLALASTATTTAGVTTVTVGSTVGLEVGMVVTGPGISGSATIVSILNGTQYVISQVLANGSNTLVHTVESDAGARILNARATVGERLQPPAGHEIAGFISSGTGYYPAGYINPFSNGVEAANLGAIIPVNALPSANTLTVRWFKKIPAPSAEFKDLYVPGKTGRYTVSYPVGASQIVIAQGVGTDDLAGAEAAGSIYYQNNSAQPGYNPNEEHALMLGGRAYALREDLNVQTGSGYTSKPFVLVAYTDAVDDRPAIHAYEVLRSNPTYDFNYTATAGTLLVKPYPLPLLPLALVGTGAARTGKDVEIVNSDVPGNATVAANSAYTGFTFKDRKGFTWVHRGPHDGGTPTLSMKLYYLSQAGFFIPGAVTQPAAGTILPFLRNAGRSGTSLSVNAIDRGQADEPLTVTYTPEWPTNAPELRVAETLTLPKFGLPQVRGQKSTQVFYQQSIAKANTATGLSKASVTLHDPTREKTVAFGAGGITLAKLPDAIKASSYQGKTYFQNLPPHLQNRFFYDPLRGSKGTLVLQGVFHDEISGEDYLDLNLLSVADQALLKGLLPAENADYSSWSAAINALATRVETFVANPAKFGTYIVDSTKTAVVNKDALAVISNPDTAVDSYALTATGQGTGFVTVVFGNGRAFTPEGDPVQVKVFKIADQLYTGDLKVLNSSNPLDEQVTLRHSGDFAGKPEDYEFEWRWATGAASSPAIYASVMKPHLGDAGTSEWLIVRDPGALTASANQYAAAGAAVTLPRSENFYPVVYETDELGAPTTTVNEAASYTAGEIAAGAPSLFLKSSVGVDFSSGVPGNIVFSAGLNSTDGCVLYVNGSVALAHNAPQPLFTLTGASSGLAPAALGKQFSIDPGYFKAGPNTIEVAVYTAADPNTVSELNFRLDAVEETDLVVLAGGSTWQTPSDPDRKLNNFALVGGSTANPFGGPQFVLNDRWFTMRYRPKASAANVLGTPWSRWMPPQLNEGWIKRVLAAINPFDQRIKDLYNNAANTDVSVITQAGTRWEGDLALNMDNINDAGLIEIYETVLNRAKSMSIDANTNDPDTNNALILAAGYLNDLYSLLGNEAFADAANPTISLDGGLVNSSRYSFEGQVASSLDEELALLRGRDDSVSPGVGSAPFYNRLVWNYTRGINSGEAIYATNYNIKEKSGSSTADGVVNEADAQNMFPQGHGDAYGHYLTALTGYYRLLNNPNFTWTPRAEAVTVLGQPVTVDFQDERKFAASASSLAATAQQVVSLTYRQNYKDDPAAGWGHYRDGTATNPQTGVTRRWGLDEEVSRSTQGALVHWAMANALLPEVDNYHTGVQKIDRTTVPELSVLSAAAESLQTTLDNANARLNPLGLSPGSIAFDIDPYFASSLGQELAGNGYQGASHYEQMADRALRSMNNAAGAFNQAAVMSGSLRDETNTLDGYTQDIAMQEAAYVNELIDIYGRPYSGDIGAGKLYAQNYVGPDLNHWFIVDRPAGLVDTSRPVAVEVLEAEDIGYFRINPIQNLLVPYTESPKLKRKTVTADPSQFVQFSDTWSPSLGSRAETGELQSALMETQQSWLAIKAAGEDHQKNLAQLNHFRALFADIVDSQKKSLSTLNSKQKEILNLERLVRDREITAEAFDYAADGLLENAEAIKEAFPGIIGVLAMDGTSAARAAVKFAGVVAWNSTSLIARSMRASARTQQTNMLDKEQQLESILSSLDSNVETLQLAYEYDNLFREVSVTATSLMQLAISHQQALQQVGNVIAKGNRVMAEREVFRQRAAAIIQGHRTKDLTFRVFRNEALEQYRSLFDLSSRYTYLAAKAYDYETGLLGTSQGQKVFDRIVASRSLGDLTGGVPQSTVSTLGDAGLAGTLAQLNADFSVAEGRLGINNPDYNGTLFSLRRELFRLLYDDSSGSESTEGDEAWQQTLEQHMVSDLRSDGDVATHCRNLKKPDGSAVPGIIIPFSSTIQHGQNFFGLDLAARDHAFSATTYATKISNAGMVLKGYVGMDNSISGGVETTADNSNVALSATPYVYLIPCGDDMMRSPPLGDNDWVRSWSVQDQALPLPYNLGAVDFNNTQFFSANGTLSEQPWIIRKHQAFRAVGDPALFEGGGPPLEFSSNRLIGRSAWNTRWKIVIPAYTLLKNEQEGLNRFAASVKDIQLYLRTYSHSGN